MALVKKFVTSAIPLLIWYIYSLRTHPREQAALVGSICVILGTFVVWNQTKKYVHHRYVFIALHVLTYIALIWILIYASIPDPSGIEASSLIAFDKNSGLSYKFQPLSASTIFYTFLAIPFIATRVHNFYVAASPSPTWLIVWLLVSALLIYMPGFCLGVVVNSIITSSLPQKAALRFSRVSSLLKKTPRFLVVGLTVLFFSALLALLISRSPKGEGESSTFAPQLRLRGTGLADGVVELSWSPLEEPIGVKKYRIYIGQGTGRIDYRKPIAIIPSDQRKWRSKPMEIVSDVLRTWLWGFQHPRQWFNGETELSPGKYYTFVVHGVSDSGTVVIKSNLWIKTPRYGGGVSFFDGGRWLAFDTTNSDLADNYVHTILEDHQGKIWFGTQEGVSRYDDQSWQTFTAQDGLAGNYVDTIFEDSQGNIWFSTQEIQYESENTYYLPRGVSRFDGQSWQPFTAKDGLADNYVYTILEDHQGKIWFGTWGGVSRYDGQSWQTFTAKDGLADNYVYTILEDRQGKIWFGTQEGVSRYDGQSWQTFTAKDGLAGNYVDTIFEDSQGNIWIITLLETQIEGAALYLRSTGVSRFDGSTWQTFTTKDGLADNSVEAILEDRQGNIWFGTREGISRYDGQSWQTFTAKDGLADNYVHTILEDHQGNIWVGAGGGLSYFDGHTWRTFTVADGLAGGFVRDILEDKEGNIWLVMGANWLSELQFPWAIAILTLLPFLGVPTAIHSYANLPSTKARRIYRQSTKTPANLYLDIYHLFAQEFRPEEILQHLSQQAEREGNEAVCDVAKAFSVLRKELVPVEKRLDNMAAALVNSHSYKWGEELSTLYRFLATAHQAQRPAEIAALEIRVSLDPADAQPAFQTSLGSVYALPPFLNLNLPDTLAMLGQTANTLTKYDQVDTPTDKLAYLADGLNQIEEAAKSVEALTEPERTVLADITAKWREIIQKEIKAISGRAELRTELRTKQALFSERLGVVLRLENVGQAVAENVRVSMEPSEEYEVVGKATGELARVSTKHPSDVEFTIHPRRADRVRLDFTITWDDREEQGKSRRFADAVSFADVEREFTRISNPYVAGNPITSSKLFFGREDVFDFLLENLVGAEQKNTLVLHGQRRTGKSSVLLQLRDRVLPQEFIPVYINMEALPDVKTMEAFLARLAYEIGRAARKRGLELEVPTDFSQQPATTFDRFMDTAEDALIRQRFVVMFDEFELIESKIAEGMDAGVLNYFRNLMQHRDSLIFVFTGTHRLQEMTHDYWSIFFSIALNREISFLEEEATRQLITEPVKGNLEYDDLTIEKIIRVTHCQPYLVQLICWQLVNYLNGQKRNYATINDLNKVLDQTLVTAEAYFNNIWEQSTSHQRLALALLTTLVYLGKETATLSEIERGLVDRGAAVTSQELIAALNKLCRHDVLEERTNGEMRYSFQIDLVRMWVEKNKPLSRVLIEEGL